ncbi:sensor domain-containing diguanylate cyclase [Xenophilus arseniciresistens]|uniref:Sensor domain-containing diguanylate cyclase n=1 Tax=Xenophilus arseniciresistens TaxID=1283306 RepID=A0AAE3NAW5_9BURK|nr:diguanylate cyclase [Xenophilus arseniciresistens]MDA7418158.1 sensor domain-containing diguanylate cyclase [Xenophilus arseniciresistens]
MKRLARQLGPQRALRWLLAFVLALLGQAALSQAPQARPVLLQQAAAEGLRLAPSMQYLEDDSRSLSLADILGPEQQSRLRFVDASLVGQEADRVLWFKLTLQLSRPEDVGREWVLVVPTVSTHDLQFYGPFDSQQRATAEPVTTGMRHAWRTRPLSSEQMAWRFRLTDMQPHTVYFRVESTFARIYDVRLWDPVDYLQHTQDKRMFDGVSYGLLMGLMVFGLILLLVFGERLYLYYLLSCVWALVAIAGFNGHVLRYPFADLPAAAGVAYTIAPALWVICKLQFGRHLLQLRHYSPWLDLVVRGILVALALATLYALWGRHPLLMFRLVQLSVVASTLVLLVGALFALRRRYWPAVLYCVGVALLLAGISAIIVASWGWLAWTPSQMNVTQAALVGELVVFAVAMASRLKLVLRSEQALIQRTQQLVEALGTDALTGAASRSGLQSTAQRWLEQQRPFALLALDLDGFKAVNDRHGHAAGDAVLMTLVSRVKAQLGPEDLVARLGGDEFAVMISGERPDHALASLATQLINAAREPIDYEGRALKVGLSMGIARYPMDGADLGTLLRTADAAMYRSKQQDGGPAYRFANPGMGGETAYAPLRSSPQTPGA